MNSSLTGGRLILPICFGLALAVPPRPAAADGLASPGSGAGSPEIRLSDEEILAIGNKIWLNEGKVLLWWDDVCQCPSLGINNYLWYQEGKTQIFDAPFLDLLSFLEKNGAKIPRWLANRPLAPWRDREAFFKEMKAHSARIDELHDLMRATIALQARYSAQRIESALPKMLAAIPEAERQAVSAQFYRVAGSPNGFYALIDYVNFKGEGVSPKERYYDRELGRDEGWGLLQVLQGMTGEGTGPAVLDEFARSAGDVIRRRVGNAPTPAQHEKELRWLPLWLNRIQSYQVHPKQPARPL